MKESIKEVIELLYEKDDYITAKELSHQLNYSTRYINQIFGEMNDKSYHKVFHINYEPQKGYKLIILDQIEFERLMDIQKENVEIAKNVLKLLIDCNDYIKIEDIAEHFFMSRSNMDRIIKNAKEICKKYKLEIQSRPKYGIRIVGTEMNKRLCSAHLSHIKDISVEETKTIQEILYSVLKEYDYSMTDINFNNLVYHLLILLRRIRSGYNLLEEIKLNKEYEIESRIADRLIEELEKYFEIHIPFSEHHYIVLHLLGKQLMNQNQEISKDIFDLANIILERIYEEQFVDLRDDLDLHISLCLHLQPLLYRLKYNFNQKNPILNRVKREMLQGYELSLVAKKVIKEIYDLDMNEDETAFLAMHFNLSLMKHKQDKQKIKFLIICSTGRGTARLLLYKLMNKYEISQENIVLSSIIQMKNMDLNQFSCVITTIPITFDVPIPVIQISPIIDDKSMNKIKKFIQNKHENNVYKKELCYFNKDFKSREEVLQFIVEQIHIHFKNETIKFDDLMKREELSPTEVGNQCCMPHPMDYYPQDPIVMVIILKKNIKWLNNKVKYIFYVSLPKEYANKTQILDEITSLVCDSEKLARLAKSGSFEKFIDMVRESL